MPKANEKDLRDVPDEVKKNMTFMFVERMDEVLHLALLRPATDELADHVEPEASTVIAPSTSPADRVAPARRPSSGRTRKAVQRRDAADRRGQPGVHDPSFNEPDVL